MLYLCKATARYNNNFYIAYLKEVDPARQAFADCL